MLRDMHKMILARDPSIDKDVLDLHVLGSALEGMNQWEAAVSFLGCVLQIGRGNQLPILQDSLPWANYSYCSPFKLLLF